MVASLAQRTRRQFAFARFGAADFVVLVLVLVQCVVLLAIDLSGSFFVDDFMLFGQAHSATLGYHYLGLLTFQHLLPLQRFTTWALLNTVGLNWTVTQLLVTATFFVTSLTVYALVKVLTERPWVAVGATGFAGISLFAQGALRWWSAAYTAYPFATFILLACLFYVLFLRSERRLHLGLAVASFAGACLCNESAALAILFLVLLRLLVADRALLPIAARVKPQAMRWRHLGWFVVLGAALLLYYRVVPDVALSTPPGVMPAVRRTITTVFDVFLPATAGVRPTQGATTLGEVAAVVVVGGLVIASIALAPRTILIWIGFAIVYVLNIGLVVWERMVQFGPGVVYDLRYFIQPSLAFTIAAACAFTAVLRRQEGRLVAGRAGDAALAAPRWRTPLVATGATAVVLYGVLATNSIADAQHDWTAQTNTPKGFLATLRHDVAEQSRLPRDAQPGLLERTLPDSVVPSWLAGFNTVSNVAPLVGHLPVGEYRERLDAVADDGHLVSVRLTDRQAFPIGSTTQRSCSAGDQVSFELRLRRPLSAPKEGEPGYVVVAQFARPGRPGETGSVAPGLVGGGAPIAISSLGSRSAATLPFGIPEGAAADRVDTSFSPGLCPTSLWLARAEPTP
ncbi:MAG TPA: hypothetical protein VGM91_08835 [Conexibacter sp.]|jgi:hypothetical protein